MRPLVLFALGLSLLGALLWGLLSQFSAPSAPKADTLVLDVTEFAALTGWTDDSHASAVSAFLRSCARWENRPQDKAIASFRPQFGTYAQWRPVCDAAHGLDLEQNNAARTFFESRFLPFKAFNHQDPDGLFTGYYEPELRGAKEKDSTYSVPLYQRPADLISVDLGEFRADLRGRRVAGRIEGTRLRPYASRAEIERAPSAEHQPLIWVDDAIDAFFLHIQGSGRVVLEDGDVVRIGYAAQNGHPYTAIGRVLIRDGHLAAEDVTMQSIRRWLDDNPAKAEAVLNENPSYVYFRKLEIDDAELGPLGAQSVPLTPGRSLAVDRKHWPLGVPLWLESVWPPEPQESTGPQAQDPQDSWDPQPLNRLMIAQDTGGAIRGPIRGDVFLGFGAQAATVAGRMKQPGTLTVLLPLEVIETHDLQN